MFLFNLNNCIAEVFLNRFLHLVDFFFLRNRLLTIAIIVNVCDNISKSKLTDHDYILLSRGLKFIPNPEDKNAKLELLKDFDELARK
jgi:hypothetical protein